ncbi:MAG: hypothetical protein AB1553_04455 [Nitrospirota bacterium]
MNEPLFSVWAAKGNNPESRYIGCHPLDVRQRRLWFWRADMLAAAEIKEEKRIVRRATPPRSAARTPKKPRTLFPGASQGSRVLLSRLAEAIVLQSIEDLWNDSLKGESLSFFSDGRFASCAKAAGMSSAEQCKLLGIIAGAGRFTE